jgi:uncharacterized repeat protein (TIGR01451 family)/LPXTG-motif cell wall-anchored protein
MSKLSSIRKVIQHVPKKVAVAFGVLAAVLIPTAIFAWGPADRPTYTIEKPADHVTFNSITNNPNYGDERNFTTAKLSSEGSNAWRDEINVTGNAEYSVNIYVHNNAASNLNLVANSTKAQVTWATGEANRVELNGIISAANASPREVWDQVVFKSDTQKFKLVYVSGSARYYNNVNPTNGFAIGDDVVKAGALLGYKSMDGNIPGCFQYSGVLNVKVKAVVATDDSFTMEKKVRLHGDTAWSKSVTANPGQEVDYQISYKNTGKLIQNSVTVRDALPTNVLYKQNTTTLRNGLYTDGNGMTLTSNNIISSGVGIGNYLPDAAAYVRFTSTMPSADKLVCGVNRLVNKGFVTVGSVTKDDTAEVTINKDCPPTPVVKYTCDALNVAKIERTKFDLTTSYTVENTTYKSITYVVKDASGKEIARQAITNSNTKWSYTQTTPGTYTVEATLNAAAGNATSAACKKTFTVDPAPIKPEYVCKVLNADRTAIKVGESVKFTIVPEYKGDVTVTGTRMDYGNGVKTDAADTLEYTHQFDTAGEYKVKAYVNFAVEGNPMHNVTSVECEKVITVTEDPTPPPTPDCKDPDYAKEHPEECNPTPPPTPTPTPDCKDPDYAKEHPEECNPTTPPSTPPTELPKTGAELFGLVGLGAATTSAGYYISSRRKLRGM